MNLLNDSPWWQSLNFLYGPYYLLLHVTYGGLTHSLFGLRLASVVCGLIAAGVIFYLSRRYYGYRIAGLSTLAFVCSFGFLALSRTAVPDAAYLLVPLLLIYALELLADYLNFSSLLIFFAIAAGSLYFPGAVWLVIIAILIAKANIVHVFKQLTLVSHIVLYAIIGLILTPIGYFLVSKHSAALLKIWLGYGLNGQAAALKQLAANFYRTPLDLLAYGSSRQPDYLRLGHLPLLPIYISVVILAGLYAVVPRFRHSTRFSTLLLLITASWLVVSLGVASIGMLLPLLIIVFGAGLAYLLKEWYAVFPKNPLAKYFVWSIVSAVVIFGCFFSARSYFVAWSNDPAVAAGYSTSIR